MKISTLFYIIRQGFTNIFRNKWYSLASIATISACLFLFGIFYAIVMNFQSIVKTAEEGVSVTVFFKQGTSQERIQEIGELIENRLEVSKVVFVTADEAWEDTKQDLFQGSEYEDGFPDNPLEGFDNYQIYMNDVSLQPALVTYLKSIPEVRKVNSSEVIATTLGGVNVLIGYVSIGIIIILLAVSIFLISNTVTIGISVRKEEINIMKYIGATDFFVRVPFVLEGIWIGLIGAIFPLWMIHLLYNQVLTYILERFGMLSRLLNFLPVESIFKVLTPVSLGVGIGIGFLGSITTVRKHLHV